MARHFSMPSFLSGKRSRMTMVAAAGTLTVAAAVSAVAVALPSGGAPAGSAAAFLTTAGRHQDATRAAQDDPVAQAQALRDFYRVRVATGERQRVRAAAAARAAAARAAARAARRRAAVKAARHRAAVRAARHRAAVRAARRRAAARAAKAAAERAAAARQQAAARQSPSTQPAPTPTPTVQQQTQPVPSGSPQQIAEQMLGQFGWSSSEFSCLDPLWTRESGWNVYASNPSSGAYGIPQALPGSRMASAGSGWQSDAATQIRWGLTYIQGRYGSPCGAWAHEQADGWY